MVRGDQEPIHQPALKPEIEVIITDSQNSPQVLAILKDLIGYKSCNTNTILLIEEKHSGEAKTPPLSLSKLIRDIKQYSATRKIGKSVAIYQKGVKPIAVKSIDTTPEVMREIIGREMQNKSLFQKFKFIVKVRGFSLPSPANDNRFVIAMDYMPGGSLHDAIQNQPPWFDNTAKVIIIYGLAHIMEFLHSNEVIHGNLKPSNILLDEEHRPYISDFGSKHILSMDDKALTNRHFFCIYYAAHELCTGGNYDKKIDVYAFGVILYEIVTGRFAYRNLSPTQFLKIITENKRETIPNTVTAFAKDLIEKCWASHPDDRPSFEEICSELKKHKESAHKLMPNINLGRLIQYTNSLDQK